MTVIAYNVDPIVSEVIKVFGPTLVGLGFVALARYAVTQFLSRFTAVEAAVVECKQASKADADSVREEVRAANSILEHKVDRALSEADKRVTVSDHRESMRQIWDAHNKDREEFIELRTEVRKDRETFAEMRAEVRAKRSR